MDQSIICMDWRYVVDAIEALKGPQPRIAVTMLTRNAALGRRSRGGHDRGDVFRRQELCW